MATFDDVSLQLPLDGADGSTTFTDISNTGLVLAAVGSAQIDTAQSKWGGASLLLSGGTDGIIYSALSAAFAFTDFTFEAWIRPSELSNSHFVFDLRYSGNTQAPAMLVQADGTIALSDTAMYGAVGTAVVVGAWHHVAWCRSGSTLRMFLDGVMQSSATYTRNLTASRTLRIGRSFSTSPVYPFIGHIDDVRITKAALYTADFTPPTSAHPTGDPLATGIAPTTFFGTAAIVVGGHVSSAPATTFGSSYAKYNRSVDASAIAPIAGVSLPALNLDLSYTAQAREPATFFGPPVSDRGEIPAPIRATWIAPATMFGATVASATRGAAASGSNSTVLPAPTARLGLGATGSAFGAFGTPKLNEQGLVTGFNAAALGVAHCSLPSPVAGFTQIFFGTPRSGALLAGTATGWTSTQFGIPSGDDTALRTRSAVFRTAFGRAQAERTAT